MSCHCSDSSFSITFKIDSEEKFSSFEFAKITCGQTPAQTGFSDYCKGRTLQKILDIPYGDALTELELDKEEEQFILHLEWDALRCAITQYLGVEQDDIDKDRCIVSSIEHTEEGTEITQIILPPKDLPRL